MTKVILSRADEVVKKFPFPRAPKTSDTTLFIAGHGTEKNENSRKAIERQVELIRAQNIYADVHAIFLEEAPRIADCYSLAQTKNLVVVPFFISDGLHAQEDIPVLLGETKRIVERTACRRPADVAQSDGEKWQIGLVFAGRRHRAGNGRCDFGTRAEAAGKLNFMKKLRFGFLSTASIGRKNWKAIFTFRQLRRDRRRQPRRGEKPQIH